MAGKARYDLGVKLADSYINQLRERMLRYTAKMIEVKCIMAVGSSIEDPCAEVWFHIIVYFGDFRYDLATKDGTSFCYLDYADSSIIYPIIRTDEDGHFSSENGSMIKKAIKDYMRELQI